MGWKYALAALAGALVTWFWQRRRSPKRQAPAGRDEMESVVEEFVSTAEILLDDFEERRNTMQALLMDADQRIDALRRLSQLQDEDAAQSVVPAPVPVPAAVQAPGAWTATRPATPPGPSEETVRAAAALIAAAQAAAREAAAGEPAARKTGARTRAKASEASAVKRKAPAKPAGPKADVGVLRHQEVLDLAQKGLGAAEIAQLIGRPTGEVQLIIGLQRSLH